MPLIEITTVLVDDEPDALNYLSGLLAEIPGIKVLTLENSVTKGVESIISHHPDIVFLDIDMPGKDGFELIREIRDLKLNTTIIFTTGHPEFAIDAWDQAAFGYLLKPVIEKKLRTIINHYRCEKIIKTETTIRHKFRTFKGYIWIDEHDIMGCKADGNYTDIYFRSGKCESIIAQLGKVEKILQSPFIFRSHRSALINIRYLFSFERKTSTVKLICQDHEVVLPVAKEKFANLDTFLS